MDIIKNTSKNSRIHFFRNSNRPNLFILQRYIDKAATEFYLKSHHLPPYEESGRKDLPIEWAFALEFENDSLDSFLRYIKCEKGTKEEDEDATTTRYLGDVGWYSFADLDNKENWANNFLEFKKREKEASQKLSNKNGIQTSLF